MIRVLLIDDHAAVRAGYARYLEADGDIQVVAEAGCADSGYAAYQAQQPDVSVCDIAMQPAGGLELLRKIRQRDPAAAVVMCSMYESSALVQSALQGGALGFVSKAAHPDNLVKAVRLAHQGQRCLSEGLDGPSLGHAHQLEATRLAELSLRELELLRLLARGQTLQDCADQLKISRKTAANYQTQIKEKLALENLTALVHLAQRHGLIDPVV